MKVTAATPASPKKELKAMAETIQDAEEEVGQLRESLNSVEIASDHIETEKRWRELENAQQRTEALYARWEELEHKATSSP